MSYITVFELDLDPYVFNSLEEFYVLMRERGVDIPALIAQGRNLGIIVAIEIQLVNMNSIHATVEWLDEMVWLEAISSVEFKTFKAIVDNSSWNLKLIERYPA